MKLFILLISLFCALLVGAMVVMYCVATFVTHHFESSEWIWEVETDDFDTIKALSYSGRLMSLKLTWSWFNMKWMFVAKYDATQH